jgi:hypothetical protein
MDLGGTIHTPVGPIPKKMAVIGGSGIALVLGIIWYRHRKTAAANAATAATAPGDIDPATGYPYGSPEDAAALSAQGTSLTSVGGGSGGGGGGSSIPGTGYATNAEWSQAVLAYFTNSGFVTDPGLYAMAISLYLSGEPAGDYRPLIEQAIAFGGMPPVPGTNGYPPSINETPSPTPTPTPTPAPTPATPEGNPYINPDGTLSVGVGVNLYDAADSVGLTGAAGHAKFASLNSGLWRTNTRWVNNAPFAIRGVPYKIK